MLDLLGRRRAGGCGGVRRRDFLRVGGLALGGLTLPNLLRSQAQAGQAGTVAAPRAKAGLLLWLPGGPSHFETWDPKPDAPADVRGPFGSIETRTPGLRIGELFPRLAAVADRFSVIRSVCHSESGHGGGERWVTTGYKSASPEFERPHDHPKVGSVVAKMRGPNVSGMLPYVAVPPSGLHRDSAAYLGSAYGPLELYSTGRQWEMDLAPVVPPPRFEARRDLLAALDGYRRDLDGSGRMDAMDAMSRQAFDLVSTGAAREAFDPAREPQAFRDRYGDHEWGKSCLLARRLIEAGTTFVTVSVGSWDQHGSAGGTILDKYREHAPQVDQAVSTLLTDLDDRGLLDETVVFLLGEFGRSPKVNNTGGRDHWPQAMSVLTAGGGLRPGVVVGATGPKGERPVDRMLGPGDLLATVYGQLGVDWRREFPNRDGRPVRLLAEGTPIRELT